MMHVYEYYGSASVSKIFEYQINKLGNLSQKKKSKETNKWWNYKNFLYVSRLQNIVISIVTSGSYFFFYF